MNVSNILREEKKQQIISLGKLGLSLRRIERTVDIRRETAAGYLKAAGIAIRPPRGWGRHAPTKPANEVITDFGAASAEQKAVPAERQSGRSPSVSEAGWSRLGELPGHATHAQFAVKRAGRRSASAG
jgi:hypothetical protein